jgi:hypothetical protein
MHGLFYDCHENYMAIAYTPLVLGRRWSSSHIAGTVRPLCPLVESRVLRRCPFALRSLGHPRYFGMHQTRGESNDKRIIWRFSLREAASLIAEKTA